MAASTTPIAFVTGATGFLGAHVVGGLLKAGCQVAAGIRADSSQWRLAALVLQPSNLTVIECDLLSPETISAAINQVRPTVVIHCAAYGVDYREQDYRVAIQTNVAGTALLVESAARAGVQRFIHVGTCYEYGDYPYPVSEDTCLRPRSVYGATKAAGTLVALERAAALGLPLVVVRPFTMYGPFEGEHKLVPQLVTACSKREALNLTAGEQVRDFVFVEDIAEACFTLTEAANFPAGEILNLGTGQGMTLHAFGETIVKVKGQDVALLRWGLRPYRQDEIMHVVANRKKALNIMGWAPTTSLADGIQKTATALERAKGGTHA